MARRLLDAGHSITAFDTRPDTLEALVQLGARAGTSPHHLADLCDTVFASLPSPQASWEVATGPDGLLHGTAITRFVDLSTIGADMARQIHTDLAAHGIAVIDSPVSGGMGGAANGTLAVMVSGPGEHAEAVRPLLETLGRVFSLGAVPGSAQTMKLLNNMLSATALAATAETLVMGVKAGLDPATMIDVINAGSGANSASKDKFPRAVLPRTFDYGFATGLMVKDLRLCLTEAHTAGLSLNVCESVGQQWEDTLARCGPDSDFTCIVKPVEQAAGIIVSSSPPTH
jgi:3-hydroxyisobutyrate dehydrogenase-like beta-hydroxyacid dehydrogenase